MKKILYILFASLIFVAGCSGGDTENKSGETEESKDDNTKDVYQIGETATGESSSYGFPYEVTVNDFELTTDAVNGRTLEDFFAEAFSPNEDTRFAIINITMANTGDDGFVLNDSFTPILMGEFTNERPETNAMSAFDEEISPGEELTADLVFITDSVSRENEKVDLYFNIHDPNLEFKFELPIP